MPGHHGLRFHDDQDLGPAGPYPAKCNPEQPLESLENYELLAQSRGLPSESVTGQEKRADVGDPRAATRDSMSNRPYSFTF
jgi:hypothetical protein